MQLNELLEEQSIKTMSQKTMISEDDLENLTLGKFDTLNRVKAFGFISILEREYDVDLTLMKSDAEEFYNEHNEDQSFKSELPMAKEERRSGGGFSFIWLLLLLLVGLAYYVTQVDKGAIHKYAPFLENLMDQNTDAKEVVEVIKQKAEVKTEVVEKVTEVVTPKSDTKESDKKTLYGVEVISENKTDVKEVTAVNESIVIIPKRSLWFGLVDAKTKKRKHFTVSEPYTLELAEKEWLIATSTASFTLRDITGDKIYKNAKSNYFKVDKAGIYKLSKAEYVASGGYRKW